MRRFLYFAEGLWAGAKRDLWVAKGLGHAFPDVAPASGDIPFGPGGAAGAIAAHGQGAGLGYDTEAMHWAKAGAYGNGVWIGWPKAKADRPGPEDLMRREVCIEGHRVLLGDGNDWIIPIVRRAPNAMVGGTTALPCVIKVDESGKPAMHVREEYEDLFFMAHRLAANVFGVEEDGQVERPEFTPEEMMKLACEALRVNYRVGPYEISALGLLDTENVKEIAKAVLDGPNLMKFIEELRDSKKNEESSPGPTCEPGAPACPDTSRPGQRSSSITGSEAPRT